MAVGQAQGAGVGFQVIGDRFATPLGEVPTEKSVLIRPPVGRSGIQQIRFGQPAALFFRAGGEAAVETGRAQGVGHLRKNVVAEQRLDELDLSLPGDQGGQSVGVQALSVEPGCDLCGCAQAPFHEKTMQHVAEHGPVQRCLPARRFPQGQGPDKRHRQDPMIVPAQQPQLLEQSFQRQGIGQRGGDLVAVAAEDLFPGVGRLEMEIHLFRAGVRIQMRRHGIQHGPGVGGLALDPSRGQPGFQRRDLGSGQTGRDGRR